MYSGIQASATQKVLWAIPSTQHHDSSDSSDNDNNDNDYNEKSKSFTVTVDDQTTKWFLKCAFMADTNRYSLFLCVKDNSPPNFKIECNFSLSDQNHRTIVESQSIQAESKNFVSERPEFPEEFPKNVFLYDVPMNFERYIGNGRANVKCELTVHLLEPPVSLTAKIQNPNGLIPSFAKMFQDENLSDFTIESNDRKTFKVHKFVLAANSEVFRQMLTSEMKESKDGICKLEDFDGEVVQAMLKFMYFQEVSELDEVARELIFAAEKYDLKELKNLCIENIVRNVKAENFVEALEISYKIINGDELFKKCVAVVLRNYKELSETSEWKNMNKELLQKVTDSVINSLMDSIPNKKRKLSLLTI